MKTNKNTFKKSFIFEDDLYVTVKNFIDNDRLINGDKNFDDNYIRIMLSLTNIMNTHFTGKDYMMSLMEREPNKNKWEQSIDADTNFGNIWECVANKFLKNASADECCPWPNGKFEFPDCNIGGIPCDYKAIISECYNDTKANITRKLPIGYLKPGGRATLYKFDEYKSDIERYRNEGILSEHLKALLIFAVYEYCYDEKTGIKYAHIHDVVVCPALFCINFNMDGSLSLIDHDKLTLGFQERNYMFIADEHFGI